MMEIMCLGWWQERKVISTVGNGCRDESQDEKEQSSGEVWAHEQRTQHWRQHVAEDMLYGMSIDWSHTDRCSPLMMHLMNTTIQVRMVKQSGNEHHNMLTPGPKLFKSCVNLVKNHATAAEWIIIQTSVIIMDATRGLATVEGLHDASC